MAKPETDQEPTALPDSLQAFKEHVEARRSGSTKHSRVRHIQQFGEWLQNRDLDVEDVEPYHIEDYVVHLSDENMAPTSIDNSRWSLNLLFDWLETRGRFNGENPVGEVDWNRYSELLNGTKKAEHVDARGGIYALDAAGVDELAEHAPEPTGRNELIIRLMYHTGVRCQELRDMKLAALDRDERRILVYSQKLDSDHVNANPRRPVWYGPSLDAHMARWLDFGGRDSVYSAADSEYLFPSPKSERLTKQTINRVVRDAAENAGLQEVLYQDAAGRDHHLVTSHTLRHSFAYSCMQTGDAGRIDLKTLAELMGHQSTETTERYLVFAEGDLRESRRLYGPK